MEDRDWTDLPGMQDENVFSNSSPETKGLEQESSSFTHNHMKDDHVENETSEKDTRRSNINEPSNPKQEKESCPICLSSFEDRSFLDQCFPMIFRKCCNIAAVLLRHSFCFCCILQWCEVVQTCPLCKSEFASLIHNVKSMQDYEQYIIEKKNDAAKPVDQTHVTYDQHGFDEHGNRFRYRTTRQVRALSSRSRSQPLRFQAASANSEELSDETRSRRHSENRRRRKRITGIERRRQIYAFKLKANGTLTSGRQRCRNISSKFYKSNPACTHRLIPWVLRDLRVLLGNSDEEINFLMEFILSLITRIDMDSQEFVNELKPFLLQTTEHFVHELLSFAKAPFDLSAYDECAVYPWPDENRSEEIRQNALTVLEENTDLPVEVQLTLARTPFSHLERDGNPEVSESHEVPEGTELVCQNTLGTQMNRNFPLNNINLNNTAESSGTSSLNERTNNATRMSGEDSRIVKNRKRSHQLNTRDTSTFVRDPSEQISPSINGLEDCIPVLFDANVNRRRNRSTLTSEEVAISDSLNSVGSNQHKRHKHDRHKHKHKKHKSKHKSKNEIVNVDLVSESGPSSVPFSSHSEYMSDSSTPRTPRKQNYEDKTDVGNESKCQKIMRRKSPTIEEMLNEISELDVKIRQHEKDLFTLGEMEMR